MSAGCGAFAVHAACIRGVEVVPVTVEIDIGGGLPTMTIVGMVDAAVMEARSRIRCSLTAAGFEMPRGHITVNLAPGDVRKMGPGFDLPIAVGILAATGQIPVRELDGALFIGELALDGRVCPVKGEVAYQLYARREGMRLVVSRHACRMAVDGVEASGLETIAQLKAGLAEAGPPLNAPQPAPARAVGDYADVIGQEVAKRAFVIATASSWWGAPVRESPCWHRAFRGSSRRSRGGRSRRRSPSTPLPASRWRACSTASAPSGARTTPYPPPA